MSKKKRIIFCYIVKIFYLCGNKKEAFMLRNLLFILSAVLLLSVATPSVANSNSAIEIIDVESQSVSISVNSSSIRVVGANGQMLYIYNVAGVKIMSIKVDGSDRYYDLNLPKGCYIVKVGKVVRKISVK